MVLQTYKVILNHPLLNFKSLAEKKDKEFKKNRSSGR